MICVPVANAILGALPPDKRHAIVGLCTLVRLHVGEILAQPDEPVRRVFFIESGFVSVMAGSPSDQVEISLIGRDGLAGGHIGLGCNMSAFKIVVQASGTAYEISSENFCNVLRDVPELHLRNLAFAQAFTWQVAETARANARHTIVSRLARWILMAHDLSDDERIRITHEKLSQLLGVRRPGVTNSLHILEGEHTIRSNRGYIRILDRDKLIAITKGAYRAFHDSRLVEERPG